MDKYTEITYCPQDAEGRMRFFFKKETATGETVGNYVDAYRCGGYFVICRPTDRLPLDAAVSYVDLLRKIESATGCKPQIV